MATQSVEDIKAASSHLRGPIAEELVDGTPMFGGESLHLLKFHGIYQQDDRDQRRRLNEEGKDRAFSCMVRCAVPAGSLAPQQWAAIDDMADKVADGTLRLTTRQGVQYHFVHKGDLRTLIGDLNRSLVTTYAACGDVVRNVMATPASTDAATNQRLQRLAVSLVERFVPQSESYWELWLDGDKAVSSETGEKAVSPETGTETDSDSAGSTTEPIYGATYLPRKFKIGITVAGDNSVDIFTHDAGIVLVDGPEGRPGAIILAGGGLGRSHRNDETFPRLGDQLGWVPEEHIVDVVQALVTTFRDFGNRENRKRARLKYVVHDRGVEWLTNEVETRSGHTLSPAPELPAWRQARHYLGWHQQSDGRWYLGIPIAGGRLRNTSGCNTRGAIRAILDKYSDEIRLTAHQDVILCGIEGSERDAVEQVLADHGVPMANRLSLPVLNSMACPALPTCGQALGEAERVLPQVTDTLEALLAERELSDVAIETRMTGCPNGCARPYVAELGIVGQTKTTYDLWIGGDPAGTRLAKTVAEAVPLDQLDAALAPLLDRYRQERNDGEAFGDWADRIGVDKLASDVPSFSRRG